MKMNSTSEVYAKLRDTCRDLKPLAGKIHVYGFTASGLTFKKYNDRDFIIGLNTSKNEGAGFAGFDMKSGATMSLEYRISPISSTNINSMYFHMLSDSVLEIREAGVSVLD